MKTENLKIVGSWEDVVNDCRSTVGKPELDKEPSNDFKRGLLISEHSPIRDLTIRWKWPGIKSWIATHFSRHKWECFITTQRSDRTGIPRDELPQSAPVDFVGSANVQALIDTMRKRLCYQASKETREYAEDLKLAIADIDSTITDVLVPNCIYRGGCPEMKSCGFYERFLDFCPGADERDLANIETRYELYNIMWAQDMLRRKIKETFEAANEV